MDVVARKLQARARRLVPRVRREVRRMLADAERRPEAWSDAEVVTLMELARRLWPGWWTDEAEAGLLELGGRGWRTAFQEDLVRAAEWGPKGGGY